MQVRSLVRKLRPHMSHSKKKKKKKRKLLELNKNKNTTYQLKKLHGKRNNRGFPGDGSGKEPVCRHRKLKRCQSDPFTPHHPRSLLVQAKLKVRVNLKCWGGGFVWFFLFCFQLRPKWAGRQREAPLFRGVVLDSKAVSSAFQMERRKCDSPMPLDSSLGHSPGDQISKHLTHSS